MKKITLLFTTILLFGSALQAQNEAIYSIDFTSTWSQATHPHSSGNLPGNAHWSALVGATHNDQVEFLAMGELATPGIKDVAELGSNGVFFSEVTSAMNAGYANQIIDGPAIATASGQVEVNNLQVSTDFPLITLASMIAPSPDWMIAINSVSLLDNNGDWIPQVSIDLYPYDAGTDSGVDYTSANNPTNPAEPISNAQGIAPFSNEIMGTITITLESLNVTNFDTTDFSISPNPANDQLRIISAQPMQTVEIYNALGARVLSQAVVNNREAQINIQELSSGVYLVQTTDSNNRKTVNRLVKL